LFFNKIQSKFVIGLLYGNYTLGRHLYTMGLIDSPLCKMCGAEEETSAHILFERESLATPVWVPFS